MQVFLSSWLFRQRYKTLLLGIKCIISVVLETSGMTWGSLRLTGTGVAIFFRCCDGGQTPELPVVRVLQLWKDHLTLLAVYLYTQGSACLPRSSVLATWHDHKARLNLPSRAGRSVTLNWPQLSPLSGLAHSGCAEQQLLLRDKTVLMLTRSLCILYPRAMRWEQILKYE